MWKALPIKICCELELKFVQIHATYHRNIWAHVYQSNIYEEKIKKTHLKKQKNQIVPSRENPEAMSTWSGDRNHENFKKF